MSNQEVPLWCVRAGKLGEANEFFLKNKYVALDGPELGDLSALPKDREAFKSKTVQAWPHFKPAAIPNVAGQYYRFIHEMQNGDIVLYPSKIDRQVHFGRVEGPYTFDASKLPNFPHRRAVKWLKEVPRTRFSQGALYEIGSALGFFMVKNYAEEFRAALEGKASGPVGPLDPTVRIVALEIEENTRDFIVKRLATELKGHTFAEFVAHLLGTMGYRSRVSPKGPDQGIDIIAHKDELGFEPPIIKVQVKSSEGSVGAPIVSALYGNVAAGEFGLLALGTVTNQTRNFAQGKSNLRLIDGEELVALILQHYEQFDSRYKWLLPFKRVYVPEPLEDEME